jgi:hypothetical protein
MANPQHKMMPEPTSRGTVTEEQKEDGRKLLRAIFPGVEKSVEDKVIAAMVPPGQPRKTVDLGLIASSVRFQDPEEMRIMAIAAARGKANLYKKYYEEAKKLFDEKRAELENYQRAAAAERRPVEPDDPFAILVNKLARDAEGCRLEWVKQEAEYKKVEDKFNIK